MPTITLDQLKGHVQSDDCYVLIHGKVYDVSKFLDEHPGGDEVILAEAGKDATEAFEDVGHSDEAREILEKLYIGDFEGSVPGTTKLTPTGPVPVDQKDGGAGGSSFAYFLPITFLAGYLAWRFYFQA